MYYEFEKKAGLIIDQQDDPGFGWEKISQFWPDYFAAPAVGVEMDKTACSVYMRSSDGEMTKVAYPVDTPEAALASSMYFLKYGSQFITNEDDLLAVGEILKEARIAHGVTIPEEFVESLFMEKEAEEMEIYADDEGNLPVSSKEQAEESIHLFNKNASHWQASDRMIISSKLEKVAEFYGIDVEFPYALKEASMSVDSAIAKRIEVMGMVVNAMEHEDMRKQASSDYSLQDAYFVGISELLDELEMAEDYGDVVKVASRLEELDVMCGMSEGWGVEYPDPVESILYGVDDTLFPEIDKTANWDDVNWEGMKDLFDGDVVDAIKSDPETIVPTLPLHQKKLVEDYINGEL